MNATQIRNIKEAFAKLEKALSETSTPEEAFRNNLQVQNAFAVAHKKLGELENEYLQEKTLPYNLRESIRGILEQLEIIEAYIKTGIRPENGDSLEDQMQEEKEVLARVNFLLALIGP